jgi:hypothetical protein
VALPSDAMGDRALAPVPGRAAVEYRGAAARRLKTDAPLERRVRQTGLPISRLQARVILRLGRQSGDRGDNAGPRANRAGARVRRAA